MYLFVLLLIFKGSHSTTQYLTISAPPEELEVWARKYYHQGVLMPRMLEILKRHYDTEQYGLG